MDAKEILNRCSEIEVDAGDALRLLRAFEVWFDKSFKVYDLDRKLSERGESRTEWFRRMLDKELSE